jgi:hypothetical protein
MKVVVHNELGAKVQSIQVDVLGVDGSMRRGESRSFVTAEQADPFVFEVERENDPGFEVIVGGLACADCEPSPSRTLATGRARGMFVEHRCPTLDLKLEACAEGKPCVEAPREVAANGDQACVIGQTDIDRCLVQ